VESLDLLKIEDIKCYRVKIIEQFVYESFIDLRERLSYEKVKDLLVELGAGNSVALGIPQDIDMSPCLAAQAYLYLLEDKDLNVKVKIRNPALRLLGYILEETQIFKFIDRLRLFNKIVVVSDDHIDLCKEYNAYSCNVEELVRLSKFRVEKVI